MALEHKEIKKSDKPRQHYFLDIKDYLGLQYEFRRNILTHEVEYRPVNQTSYYVLDDAKLNTIWIDLQINGFKCSDAILAKLLNSDLFPTHHPLKQYFDGLPKYDGEDWIGKLAGTVRIQKTEIDNINLQDLWRPYLEKWLIASAATPLGKGVNHLCLILVGGQGVGKTTWLNKLCPETMQEFLVCSHISPSLTDPNTANFLAEKWFVNVDDQLENIFGKDFNSMKALITAPFVTNRKAWHRHTRKRQRICSFMGSVNNPEFLTDSENRRYLVFTAEDIDSYHKINMDKVWSQVLHLLNEGRPYWFNKEEIVSLNKVNDKYRQVSIEEEWLIKLFPPCDANNPQANFLMTSEILSKINAWSGLKLSLKKLGMALHKLQYQRQNKRINGQPRQVYFVLDQTSPISQN